MTSKFPQYHYKIRSLLTDKDLDGLIEVLRNPANADWRIQAAQALAELENVDAAESLMRAILEDFDPAVQSAARQTLQQLLGSQMEMALTVHRSGPAFQEAWLMAAPKGTENGEEEAGTEDENWEGEEQESGAEDENEEGEEPGPEDEQDDLSDVEIDSYIRIALYEANVSTRLRAIHALADSNNLQATYALARLTLWGDTRILRNAARYALEKRYGDQTEEILKSYQDDDPDTSDESFEDEEFTEEESEEEPDNQTRQYEILEPQTVEYPRVKAAQTETMVEEMGTPRWLVLLGILAVLIVVTLLLQSR